MRQFLLRMFLRFLGVLAILIGLGTLAVAVLLWIGRGEGDAASQVGGRGSTGAAKPPRRLLLVEQPDRRWRADDGASYAVQRRE
ncbi:MAG: hypothetical protein IPN34_15095 [Planctomycetes bacterium]|nr:hypothetical protein [Planctomycetota bacterium]